MDESLKNELLKLAQSLDALADEVKAASEPAQPAAQEKTASDAAYDFGTVSSIPARGADPLLAFCLGG